MNEALNRKAASRRLSRTPATLAGVFALLVAAAAPAEDVEIGLCLDCHGAEGAGTTPETPLLGGQPELFLLYQLVFFRGGQRKNETMNGLMEGAPDGELSAYAAALAALPVREPEADRDEALFARGETLAGSNRCESCHLSDYSGAKHVPRLAGQREAYLVQTMTAFREGDRIGIQAAMAEVMHGFSDEDIAATAHYLSQLGAE